MLIIGKTKANDPAGSLKRWRILHVFPIANIQSQKLITQKEVGFLPVENELNLEKYPDTANSLRGRMVISRMCLVNS